LPTHALVFRRGFDSSSHLMLGSDEQLSRWLLVAEKIATAVSLARRDGGAILHLTEAQKREVAVALDAMVEGRGEMLSDSLHMLRRVCA
jgi:hypothetical protein